MFGVIMAAMPPMSAMTVKQMHQRTGEDQQIGQRAEDMRPMLGEQEKAADRQEAKEDKAGFGPPPGRILFAIRVQPHVS